MRVKFSKADALLALLTHQEIPRPIRLADKLWLKVLLADLL